MLWCCVTVGSTPQGHVPSEIWFYSSRSSLISSIANTKLSLWLLKFRSTDLNLFIDQLIYLYKIYRCFQFLCCSVPIGNIEKMIAQIKIFVFDQAERVESYKINIYIFEDKMAKVLVWLYEKSIMKTICDQPMISK